MAEPLAWRACIAPWIATASWPERRAPWSFPQRRLYDYLLVCSFDGEEWVRLEDEPRERRIPRGASYLIPPRILFDKGSHHGNRPAMCHFDLRFHPRRDQRPRQGPFDRDLAGREPWLQPDPAAIWGVELPILLPQDLWPACRDALPAIVTGWQSGDRWGTLRAQQRLGDLLLSIAEWAAARAAPQRDHDEERIARAERVALQSLAQPFGVEAFAAAAGLRRSQFHRRYREVRGETPAAFLRRQRLACAARLLRDQALSAAAIGRMVGYDDPAVFSRAFRAAYGATPGAWRAAGSG